MRNPSGVSFPVIPASEGPAYEVLSGSVERRLVILCDHASNWLPPEYGGLGLAPTELHRHIAYDIGAAGIARSLAEALGAPAILSRFSRLLIDPNRGLDDPTLIMRIADGTIIPGNREIPAAERRRRIECYYEPYHQAVAAVIGACLAAGVPPALLSIHTFTSAWKGVLRPWHAGILWDACDRLARPLIAALAAEPGLIVGDNEPYSGKLPGDTMWRHGTGRGLVHALVEIRQDLVSSPGGQEKWAARLARLLPGCLERALAETPCQGQGPSRPRNEPEKP